MFVRERPNRLWVTDITEHPTREGKVYCAVVLDAFSRRVVGWSISHNPTAALMSPLAGNTTARTGRSPLLTAPSPGRRTSTNHTPHAASSVHLSNPRTMRPHPRHHPELVRSRGS